MPKRLGLRAAARPLAPNTPAARAVATALTIMLVTWLAGCSSDNPLNPVSAAAARRGRPRVTSLAVGPNALNALSTVVSFTASGADSARVIYSAASDTTTSTPYVPVVNDSGRVVTLGHLPNTNYAEILQIVGPGGTVSESFQVATGDLPTYVKTASLAVNGTFGPGYTLVSPIMFNGDSVIMLAFDRLGRVRWYRTFPPGTGAVETKQQPNGHFTIALGGSAGNDEVPVQFAELLPSGEITTTYGPPAGEFMDAHELLMTGDASAPTLHFFGYNARVFDYSALGGRASGPGLGHQLIRESPPGTVQFLWDAWDHYTIADWIEPTGVAPPFDFDHPNSLAFDLDGNYIVSFRHLGAVVKLDAQTGATMWQLGGRLNQFAIRGDPLNGFTGQHSVRILDNGHLLMYDNGLRHNPPHTRAVEYALDVGNKTATMVWEYEPSPVIFTPFVGSAQRLANGHTLVGFGVAGQIHEVDAGGRAVATAAFAINGRSLFYRAIRVRSLYEYQKP